MSHDQARRALQAGTPLDVICATCPWDRLCILPPTTSRAEIDRQIEEAEQKDVARDPERKSMPVGMLLAAMTLAGKDTSGQLCPVFAARLTGPAGRRIADQIREQMQGWGDQP